MVSSTLHKFFLAILLLVLITGKVFATTYDWVGTSLSGGVYNWNDKLNWQIGGVAANAIPGPGDVVMIAVNAFSNDPTVTDVQKCASIVFGVYDNITLTVNGTLTVSGDITQNNDPNLDQTTVLQGTGTITCNNFNLGDNTPPASGNGIVINLSSQVNQFNIKGNIVLNAVGNGGDGIEYPFFSLDANKLTLTGQITTKTFNSPTIEGVGDPSYPGYGLFQMDSYASNTTLELLNTSPILTPIPTGFTVDFTNNGSGAGTVIYDAPSGTQTVYSGGTSGLGINAYNYDYLTFGGASAKSVIGGQLTIGNDWTSAGTGAVDLSANNPTMSIGGNWTNSVNVTLGSNSLSVGNAMQITTGIVTANAGTLTVNGMYQNSGGTLKCGAGNIIFKGAYTNNKTFTPGTGTVYFSGASQTLTDNSTAGTLFNNVTFNGTGTAVMSAGTGNFSVSSSGVLSLVTPAKLTAGSTSASYLTLKSDATGSATIAAMSGVSAISGNVNVQRYLSGGSSTYRAYRLLSCPVYVAAVGGINVSSLDYIKASMLVTGISATGGFDKVANPSIYMFREDKAYSIASYTSGNFWGVSALNNSPSYNLYFNGGTTNYNIPAGNGMFIFFRGDRTTNLANKFTPGTSAESVTMTASGTLNQGQVTVRDWYTPASTNLGRTTATANTLVRGFNLMGNPYASSLDWETYNISSSTTGIYAPNVKPSIYLYNVVTKNYAVYTKGLGGVGTNGATNVIPSGQGFFIIATSAAAKMVFNESAKTNAQVTGTNLLMGKPANIATLQYLRLKLSKDSDNTDDLVIRFTSTASTAYIPDEDAAYKQGQGDVSLCSISSDNVDLAINNLPLPKKSETIGLYAYAITDGVYKLTLTQVVGVPQLYDVWLMDAYKKDSLNIRYNPNYLFNVYKADTNSFGAKRFSLVIRQNPAYAYRLLNFTAGKLTSAPQVQIAWKTENEGTYTNFTIERSTDGGKTFDIIGSQTASAQNAYGLVDKNPVSGQNIYMLKQEDVNGTITYSAPVTVMYSDKPGAIANNGKINVYPNPATSVINLAIAAEINSPSYKISITNSTGLIIKQATADQNTWQTNLSNLLPGTYLIQVIDNKDKSLIGNTKFVKL